MRKPLLPAVLALLALGISALYIPVANAQIRILNNGADAGVVNNINCVGGLNCQRSGSTVNVSVDAGPGLSKKCPDGQFFNYVDGGYGECSTPSGTGDAGFNILCSGTLDCSTDGSVGYINGKLPFAAQTADAQCLHSVTDGGLPVWGVCTIGHITGFWSKTAAYGTYKTFSAGVVGGAAAGATLYFDWAVTTGGAGAGTISFQVYDYTKSVAVCSVSAPCAAPDFTEYTLPCFGSIYSGDVLLLQSMNTCEPSPNGNLNLTYGM